MTWLKDHAEFMALLVAENPTITVDEMRTEYPHLLDTYGSEAVSRKIRRLLNPDPPKTPKAVAGLDDLEVKVLKRLKKDALTVEELCDKLDRGPSSVQAAIRALQEKSYRVDVRHGVASVIESVPSGYHPIPVEHFRAGKQFLMGVVSDTHLCNENARLDFLNHAYDVFEEAGVSQVFHGGNWIDGEAPFNKIEQVTAPGFERQVNFFLANYPQKSGIITSFVDGDDHEGWYAQKQGIEPGKRLEQSARAMGRTDLEYLGYSEADIPLTAEGAEEPAILRLTHGGGGGSYAISYVLQKYLESLSGGEKPQMLLMGHHHKAEYLPHRGCHAFQMGCLEDQSLFMRKRKIQAKVGFWIIEATVQTDGTISRVKQEFHEAKDRGYYRHRYSIGDRPLDVVAPPRPDTSPRGIAS